MPWGLPSLKKPDPKPDPKPEKPPALPNKDPVPDFSEVPAWLRGTYEASYLLKTTVEQDGVLMNELNGKLGFDGSWIKKMLEYAAIALLILLILFFVLGKIF